MLEVSCLDIKCRPSPFSSCVELGCSINSVADGVVYMTCMTQGVDSRRSDSRHSKDVGSNSFRSSGSSKRPPSAGTEHARRYQKKLQCRLATARVISWDAPTRKGHPSTILTSRVSQCSFPSLAPKQLGANSSIPCHVLHALLHPIRARFTFCPLKLLTINTCRTTDR